MQITECVINRIYPAEWGFLLHGPTRGEVCGKSIILSSYMPTKRFSTRPYDALPPEVGYPKVGFIGRGRSQGVPAPSLLRLLHLPPWMWLVFGRQLRCHPSSRKACSFCHLILRRCLADKMPANKAGRFSRSDKCACCLHSVTNAIINQRKKERKGREGWRDGACSAVTSTDGKQPADIIYQFAGAMM